MNNFKQCVYNRFVRYVAFDTTSYPSDQLPSTPAQLEFSKMLANEMTELGLTNVSCDKYGFAMGEIPPNVSGDVAVVGFLAHVDTVCDFNGKNIKPQLHPNYDGKTLTINAEKKMFLSPESAPSLLKCIGHDVVTTDGNSILAADDKIGVATLMTLAEYLMANPQIKHGAVRLAFTIDEETGVGISAFDIEKFRVDFAYTLDGGNLGDIDYGNFNADKFDITITGKSCHPGAAKGFMANPVRIMADIISTWPQSQLPETTDGEEGFVLFKDIKGSLEEGELSGIIRDHDLKKFEKHKVLLSEIIKEKQAKYPNAKIELSITRQYRNMKDVLEQHPQAMRVLEGALKDEGVQYQLTQARGGTDGAQLTLRGLPTPNLFAGYENPHGPYEWLSLQWVEKVFNITLAILQRALKESK